MRRPSPNFGYSPKAPSIYLLPYCACFPRSSLDTSPKLTYPFLSASNVGFCSNGFSLNSLCFIVKKFFNFFSFKEVNLLNLFRCEPSFNHGLYIFICINIPYFNIRVFVLKNSKNFIYKCLAN
jgi:hypothetical protein